MTKFLTIELFKSFTCVQYGHSEGPFRYLVTMIVAFKVDLIELWTLFLLPRSIKWALGIYGEFVGKSKLSSYYEPWDSWTSLNLIGVVLVSLLFNFKHIHTFSSVFHVNFKHLNAGWVFICQCLKKNCNGLTEIKYINFVN